jgi:prepilin-type N-terminal cleavage/methylation domain-containing protein
MTRQALIRTARARLGRQEGFTLIELLVVMLIAAVLSVAILAIFSSVTGAFDSQTVRIRNQDDARTAINQMARYIRMATSSADNVSSQSNSIVTALPKNIEFYCDLVGDGVPELVRYYLDGDTLLMQTAEATWATSPAPAHWDYPAEYATDGVVVEDSVINGTADAVFRYYKYASASGTLVECTPTTDAGRQEIVAVSIAVEVNARTDLVDGAVMLATDVQIRQRYQGGLK